MRTLLFAVICLVAIGCTHPDKTAKEPSPKTSETIALKGFSISPHWSEQMKEYDTGSGVRVHINAPSISTFKAHLPTKIVYYPLPNGNSIEWTVGRAKAEGLDWHYFIQHIGAQTRRLREVMRDCNIVVVYLEANNKSWPRWRSERENNSELIAEIVQQVQAVLGVPNPQLTLSGHSGGGSFNFGFINAFEKIPDSVERICFLDSNYGFSVEDGHGDKLLEWLERSKTNRLVVLAYDDREIMLDGKKVLGPTGGTFRATQRMVDFFTSHTPISLNQADDLMRYSGMNDQISMIIHQNPKNEILHTVLVGDMNGFIHSMALGTPYEKKACQFNGKLAYEKWIQPF